MFLPISRQREQNLTIYLARAKHGARGANCKLFSTHVAAVCDRRHFPIRRSAFSVRFLVALKPDESGSMFPMYFHSVKNPDFEQKITEIREFQTFVLCFLCYLPAQSVLRGRD
jgi:hypothetical protein